MAAAPIMQQAVFDKTDRASEAFQVAENRLKYYVDIVSANRDKHQPNDTYYSEEKVTLKDGGILHHVVTPNGRAYFLRKGDKWMFLERSTNDQIKTLYICEKDELGKQKFTEQVALHL